MMGRLQQLVGMGSHEYETMMEICREVDLPFVGSESSLWPISITTKSPTDVWSSSFFHNPSEMKERELRPFLARLTMGTER
jgi:hypothetical protein